MASFTFQNETGELKCFLCCSVLAWLMQCPWISAGAVTLIFVLLLTWKWEVLLASTWNSVCAQLLGAFTTLPVLTDFIYMGSAAARGADSNGIAAENLC